MYSDILWQCGSSNNEDLKEMSTADQVLQSEILISVFGAGEVSVTPCDISIYFLPAGQIYP